MKTIKTIVLVIGLFLQMALTAQPFHQYFGQSDDFGSPKVTYSINGDFSVIGRTHIVNHVSFAEISLWSNTGTLVAQRRLEESNGGDLKLQAIKYDPTTDLIYALVNAADKGFFFPGGGTQLKYFSIYAFDINLNLVWDETYADNPNGLTTGFCINTESEYIFVGGMTQDNVGQLIQSSMMSMIDKNTGALIVTEEYQFGLNSWITDMAFNDVGHLFVTGVVEELKPCILGGTQLNNKEKGYVMQLDQGLNLLNQRTFEDIPVQNSTEEYFLRFHDIEIYNNEIYLFGSVRKGYYWWSNFLCHFQSCVEDLLLLRMDQALGIINSGIYSHVVNSCSEIKPGKMLIMEDEVLGTPSILLSGHRRDFVSPSHVFLLETELDGNIKSSMKYQNDTYDYNADIDLNSDEEVIMVYDRVGVSHEAGHVLNVFSNNPSCPSYHVDWITSEIEIQSKFDPVTPSTLTLSNYGNWSDLFVNINYFDVCPPPIPPTTKGEIAWYEIYDLNGQKLGVERSLQNLQERINNSSLSILLVRTVYKDGNSDTQKVVPGMFIMGTSIKE